MGMDSLVLVKMATNEFEARPVYSKSNLHIDWHALGVCHGKLYGVKTGVLISVDLETGNAEEVDRRIESFAWRDQKIYAFVRPPGGSLLLRVYDANMEAYRDISARPYSELVPAQASSVPRIQISPDHKCLAYFCRSNSVVLSHMYELRTVAVNDGTLKALSTWVGARRFLTGGGDVADGPLFAWLDSKTLLVVRDVSKKPQSIQGQSRIYAAESGRTEMILAQCGHGVRTDD